MQICETGVANKSDDNEHGKCMQVWAVESYCRLVFRPTMLLPIINIYCLAVGEENSTIAILHLMQNWCVI